jgi:hypothetical protein
MDLEKLIEIISKYLEILSVHWSFVALSFIIAMLGEVPKALIIEDRDKKTLQGWRKVYIRTITFHPVIVGAIFGIFLEDLVPESITGNRSVASILYFALAGGFSTWLYSSANKIVPDVVQSIRNRLLPKSKDSKTEDSE